jgi:hypothetical protein
MTKTIDDYTQQLAALVAEARANIEEPLAFEVAPGIRVEVRPLEDDCRVSVMKEGHGFTCINYTHEGLILDVFDENADEVHTASVFNEDLALGESHGPI